MKNKILFCIILFTSWHSEAQKIDLNQKEIQRVQNNVLSTANESDLSARKVTYYYVEEIVDMKFGGHKTVYTVAHPELIQTHNLGPNGKRTITPVYEQEEQYAKRIAKVEALKKSKNTSKISIAIPERETDTTNLQINYASTILPTAITQQQQSSTINAPLPPLKSLHPLGKSTPVPEKDTNKPGYNPVGINIIKTYERIVEKGYVTVDLLKYIANAYFFNNELVKAEKYYTLLFNKTTDLEPEYYYRYAVCLKATGQLEKSNKFIKKSQ